MQAASLTLDGIFTHFTSSEDFASPLTQTQERRFEQAIAQVREAGLQPAWVHAGNSSTVDNPAQGFPLARLDLAATVGARAMVRPGIALYGYACRSTAPAPARSARPETRHDLEGCAS
jgi:alanine racemase